MMLRAAALFAAYTLPALADHADGTWRTQPNEDGAFLLIVIAPCESDAALSCGLIAGGENVEDETIFGEIMIRDMAHKGKGAFGDGTIWAPDDDKTYRSKMQVNGDVLTVKGCILGGIICRGQDWTRAPAPPKEE